MPRDLLHRGPVGDQRAAVEHVAAALGGAERASARSVRSPDGDLDAEPVEQRRVAGRAHQAAHPMALRDQPLRQVPADEAGRARDQAGVVAGHRRRDARRRSVAVAMSRTTPQFLLARAVAVGEHGVERAEEAARLGLGERQRRQQLDHVVLAGRHRDHAVVAVQRDHDQLGEQALAGHVDQAPVQPGDPRARRAAARSRSSARCRAPP